MFLGKLPAGRPEPIVGPSEPGTQEVQPVESSSNNDIFSVLFRLLPLYKSSPSLYWKSVRLSRKLLAQSEIASIHSGVDNRPLATISIADQTLTGLLDSGASISCLGKNAVAQATSFDLKIKPIVTSVKTADGAQQKVVGYVDVPITFNHKTKLFRLYLIPSLSQELYLGIDFWKAFGIEPSIVSEIAPSVVQDPNMHELTAEQKLQLDAATSLLPSSETLGLGKTDVLCHTINTTDSRPIKQRHYPVSPAVEKEMYSELDRMLSLGVIEESNSPWNSPVVMVRKHCGKARLCLDSRGINNVTIKDAYPLPIIDGILSRLGDTFYISSIDLKDAFWQIELDAESREKTAFTVPGRPLYQFARMPFGLCNAAQTMCRLMDRVIGQELREFVFVYIDDLMIVSSDFETHVSRIRAVAECLRKANLTINVAKSKFAMKQIKYLGYIVGNGCLKTDPDKIRAIVEFPRPKTVRQLRSFLGLTGWYQRFIKNYSAISAPLSNIRGSPEKFQWSEEAQKAFDHLKMRLTSAPILSHPNFERPFVIQCDASATGVGSVLFQVDENGEEHPIAFMSKKLNSAQRNYSVTELECYAAVLSVKKFRPYVEGMEFKILTDHASLKWLMSQKDLSGRLARWSLKLQSFRFSIEHRKGSANIVPDALSRVFVEEVSSDPLSVDLSSEQFRSDEYLDLLAQVKANADRLPDLSIVDDKVFIKTEFGNENDSRLDETPWKLWVPNALTADLIARAHDPPLASHGGIAKTLDRLKNNFFWPSMSKQVRDYIAKCDVCKESKAPNIILRPPMGSQFIVSAPWQRLYIDLLGPYPRSKSGNVSLLIVLDQFSKFVLLKPLRKATSASIVTFVESEVFHMFGVPESILSDNGVQFISEKFKTFLERYGVRHITTATHSPQANASERVNRSILAAIRTYLDSDQQNWDVHISSIASALRSAVHQSIGYSPYFAVFGRRFVQHGSNYELLKQLRSLPTDDLSILPPPDFQNVLCDQIRQRLSDSHENHERVYNTRTRFVSYIPGQEVYRRNFVQSDFKKMFNAKLAKKFVKCRIVRKIGNVMYEVEDMQGNLIAMKYHAKDLRP